MSDHDFIPPVRLASAPAVPPSGAPRPPSSDPQVWQNGDTASFRDVLAILNPLQHIPIVSSIYRAATGDGIGFMPRVIGSAIYGGPIGFVVGLATSLFKSETGKDPGEMVMAGLFGGPKANPDEPLVAAKQPPLPPNSATPAPTVTFGGSPDEPLLVAAKPPAAAPAEPAAEPSLQAVLAQAAMAQRAQAVPARAAQTAAAAPMAAAAAPPAKPPAPTAPGGMPLTFQSPASSRFRSTTLPQPQVDGGAKTHAGNDLVPTAAGQAIPRDDVPVAMSRALEKYAAMMKARNAGPATAQVSELR